MRDDNKNICQGRFVQEIDEIITNTHSQGRHQMHCKLVFCNVYIFIIGRSKISKMTYLFLVKLLRKY